MEIKDLKIERKTEQLKGSNYLKYLVIVDSDVAFSSSFVKDCDMFEKGLQMIITRSEPKTSEELIYLRMAANYLNERIEDM